MRPKGWGEGDRAIVGRLVLGAALLLLSPPCAASAGAQTRGTETARDGAYVDAELTRMSLDLRGFYRRGDSQGAVQVGEAAVALAMGHTTGPDDMRLARARSDLAIALWAAGRLAEAMGLHREALAARERVLGPEHADTLGTRLNLAVTYKDMGRLSEAVALYREVLAVQERTLGVEQQDTMRTRHNLANAYREMGHLADAVALYTEVLAAQERTLGVGHPDALRTRHNLGTAYLDMGRLAEAAEMFREVLRVEERTLGADHADTLRTRHNLAIAYADMGRHEEAVGLYRDVLATLERTLGSEHPTTLRAREHLAQCVYIQGHFPEAAQAWETSLQLRNVGEARLAAVMNEAGRIAVTSTNFSDGDLTSAALQTSDAVLRRLAAAARVTRHARSNEGVSATLEAARGSGRGDSVDTLVQLQAEYARLAAAPRPDLAAVHEVGVRIDRVWAELAGPGALAGQGQRDPLTELEAAWRALAPDEALVHLVQFRPLFPRQVGSGRFGESRYAAFVLRGSDDPTSAPAFIDLGLGATLDESVARFHDLLMGQVQGNVLHASSEVYARLVRPLRPLLGAATTVFVVSDGATAQVPWHALVTSMDGGPGGFERYLMDEGLTVLTLSSARELVRTLPASSTGAAVVMAPFAGVSPENNGLPGTEREARAVASMLDVTPRLTGDASYAALRTGVQTAPRVLHIATHGYAQEHRGDASPLSFVGLRFAPGDGDDARVSASRMAVELPLLGTDLVVLSACESGLGSVTPGQDIASTRQAFHIAGARHVMASLWPVDDAAAAFFMERFYTHVLAGVTVVQAHSRALRETRDHRRRGRHGGPYSAIEKWAPFVLSVVPARGASRTPAPAR